MGKYGKNWRQNWKMEKIGKKLIIEYLKIEKFHIFKIYVLPNLKYNKKSIIIILKFINSIKFNKKY